MTVATQARDEAANGAGEASVAFVRSVAWLTLAAVSLLWLGITRDAWRIRSIVSEYLSVHGGIEIHGPWPDHLHAFHDDLMGAGADYFYPFAWGVVLAAGLFWIVAAVIATTNLGRARWALVSAGVIAVVLQLVVLGPALATYTDVTT